MKQRMPIPEEILRQWIDAIKTEASDKLSSWETDFVESVESAVNLVGRLSQKQEEILERIYSEKTS